MSPYNHMLHSTPHTIGTRQCARQHISSWASLYNMKCECQLHTGPASSAWNAHCPPWRAQQTCASLTLNAGRLYCIAGSAKRYIGCSNASATFLSYVACSELRSCCFVTVSARCRPAAAAAAAATAAADTHPSDPPAAAEPMLVSRDPGRWPGSACGTLPSWASLPIEPAWISAAPHFVLCNRKRGDICVGKAERPLPGRKMGGLRGGPVAETSLHAAPASAASSVHTPPFSQASTLFDYNAGLSFIQIPHLPRDVPSSGATHGVQCRTFIISPMRARPDVLRRCIMVATVGRVPAAAAPAAAACPPFGRGAGHELKWLAADPGRGPDNVCARLPNRCADSGRDPDG
eukprot:363234-Chlamydomonas_euryale.AAC.7